MVKIEAELNLLKNIVISVEATFVVNGYVSRRNSRYLFDENPHWYCKNHTQIFQAK